MPALKNLENEIVGRLKILRRAPNKGNRRTAWYAICECGKECVVAADDLKRGDTTSCGCIRSERTVRYNKRERFKKEKEKKKKKTDGELLQEAIERFFMNVQKTDSCWNWEGPTIRGYGIMFFKKNIRAPRFSFLIHNGNLDSKLLVCHTCDNPICVNPDHLYQGTSADNRRDAVERKRAACCEKHHKSKLKESEVLEILSSNETGRKLAIKFGVHTETIYRIRKRTSWKNVSD